MSREVDLLVVGGGPAGATLGALAAGAGARVELVDRATFPRDKVCGEFVSAEGCGVLERLGVLGDLRAAGTPRIGACRITDPRGARLDEPLPELRGHGREALGISRALLDVRLLEQAERRGVRVRTGTMAVDPVLESGRVCGLRLRAAGGAGADETVRARIVVAADGRRSVLGRRLDPRGGDPTRSTASSWFGLKTHRRGEPSLLDGRVELHLFDGGYAGVAAVEDGRINLCLMTTVRALRECGGRPERLLAERVGANPFAHRLLGATAPDGGWHSVGPLAFGVRRPVSHGALFVGDAAGTVDPFCGEGMANALRGAELAAPVVLDALARGALTPALAVRYRRAWLRSFAPVTRRVRWIGRLLERPGLSHAALALLGRRRGRLAPRLVALTRTGWNG